jgi:hypothetical protein
MAMLERFLDAAAALDGVVFDRLDHYVERWSASSGASTEAAASA